MKTRFGISLGIIAAGLTVGVCVLGVACGGDDDDDVTPPPTNSGTGTATTTSTGTGTATTTSTGTGTGTGVDCNAVCGAVYACGQQSAGTGGGGGAAQLCPGFTPSCVSESTYLSGSGGGSSGCIATCEGPTGPVLAALVDPNDCAATVAALAGANSDFACACSGASCAGTAGAGGCL